MVTAPASRDSHQPHLKESKAPAPSLPPRTPPAVDTWHRLPGPTAVCLQQAMDGKLPEGSWKQVQEQFEGGDIERSQYACDSPAATLAQASDSVHSKWIRNASTTTSSPSLPRCPLPKHASVVGTRNLTRLQTAPAAALDRVSVDQAQCQVSLPVHPQQHEQNQEQQQQCMHESTVSENDDEEEEFVFCLNFEESAAACRKLDRENAWLEGVTILPMQPRPGVTVAAEGVLFALHVAGQEEPGVAGDAAMQRLVAPRFRRKQSSNQ